MEDEDRRFLLADPMDQVAFVAEALRWKGRPFLLNGESWDGVGCVGLLKRVLGVFSPRIAELELPRGTGRHGLLARVSEWMKEHPELFAKGDATYPEIGDVFTYRLANVGEFHTGLYLGIVNGTPRSFIHSAARYGVSVSNLFDTTYVDRVVKCWRPLA